MTVSAVACLPRINESSVDIASTSKGMCICGIKLQLCSSSRQRDRIYRHSFKLGDVHSRYQSESRLNTGNMVTVPQKDR